MSDNELPLTSVVMVAQHTGPRLERAVAAVLGQTAPVELVLVNAALSPDVEAWALAKNEPRLKVVSGQGDVGQGAAKNLGAREAKGDALLFLHPEALLPPTAVARLAGLAGKTRSPFMFGARLVDEQGMERPESRRALLTPLVAFIESLRLAPFFPKLGLSRTTATLPPKVVPMPAIGGACMFLPANDFIRINGFDERCLIDVEDMDFCLRFHRSGGKTYFVPDLEVNVTHETGCLLDRVQEEKKAQSLAHYFHENFGHAYPQPVLWALDAVIWAKLTPLLFRRYLDGRLGK